MKMTRQEVFKYLHIHFWHDYSWNVVGWPVEQKCRCGAFRHRYYTDLLCADEALWHEGRMPGATYAHETVEVIK